VISWGPFWSLFTACGSMRDGYCISFHCSHCRGQMLPEWSLTMWWTQRSTPGITSFGFVSPGLRYPCGQVVFCVVNLGTFFKCFLQLGWGLTGIHFNSNWMFPECSLMEALCDWTRSFTPGIRRLVLLTLVLGTHVCKLYFASTLVLFF
jgi:hypothetical protein